ncbi:MAG: translation initiation factor IF-3 [Chloroflexi bacterium]|nr:translation initiation factor IF-3 [Chloroflexota bacterium]
MRSIRQVWPYLALFDGAQFGGNGSPGVTGSANIAKEFRVNRRIRADEVRVVRGEDSTESVVMPLHDALDMALDEGLDLVEVGPNQNPPVVRILDYGRFKFIQSKKQREARKISRSASRQKDVRLSPVMSDNDIETKIRTTKNLLGQGAKVRVFVRFRGRQRAHPEIAMKVLRKVAEGVASVAKLEKPPGMEGRVLSILLAPSPQQKERERQQKASTVATATATATAAPASTGGSGAESKPADNAVAPEK